MDAIMLGKSHIHERNRNLWHSLGVFCSISTCQLSSSILSKSLLCGFFFPFVQMESLFQLCNYCSSDFRAVSPLQICAGSHFVHLEKLDRCDFLIASRNA